MKKKTISEKHQDNWMALSHDKKKVIVKGESLIQTFEKAKEVGESDPIMYKVHPKSACLLL